MPQNDVQVTPIGDGAYHCRGVIGSQEITIRTGIVGDRFGFIEDCIGDLLDRVWGNQITESDKESYKTAVNSAVTGSNFRSLVDAAEMEDLRESFPAISAVLEDVAETGVGDD